MLPPYLKKGLWRSFFEKSIHLERDWLEKKQ